MEQKITTTRPTTARRYATRLASAAAFVLLLVGAAWSSPAAAVGGGPPGTGPSLSHPDGGDTTGLRPGWLAMVGAPLAAGGLVVASRSHRQRQQIVRRFRTQLDHPSAMSLFLNDAATESALKTERPNPASHNNRG